MELRLKCERVEVEVEVEAVAAVKDGNLEF